MIVIDREKRRLYILHCRIHHGLVGCLMFGLGLWLMLNDRHDAPWLRDNL